MQQNIEDMFEAQARKGDGQFAIAFAIMQVAREHKNVAYQLGRLGLADAVTPMGAIEILSKALGDGLDGIASAITEAADQG